MAAAVMERPSWSTRRSISYLTCTRSRASKNSPAANSSSAAACGRGLSDPSWRKAWTLGSGAGGFGMGTS